MAKRFGNTTENNETQAYYRIMFCVINSIEGSILMPLLCFSRKKQLLLF
jgi:hypothetical protein